MIILALIMIKNYKDALATTTIASNEGEMKCRALVAHVYNPKYMGG
jgi:hypothetical protein